MEVLCKPRDGARLNPREFVAVVLVNGSAFPLEWWGAVFDFLKAGGHLFYLGGNPFSRPFQMVNGMARLEPEATAFARSLGITQSFPLAITPRHEFDAGWKKAGLSRCWRLFYLLNQPTPAEIPAEELGWQGEIDAQVRPLIPIRHESHFVASAAVLITQEGGAFKRSRWMLAPCQLDRPLDAGTTRELFLQTISAQPRWQAEPTLAVYRANERPRVSIRSSFPSGKVRVRIKSADALLLEKECVSGESIALAKGLPRGFYTIECLDSSACNILTTNGFWIARPGDMRSGRPLGVNADWLTRGGGAFAVSGTTYMCGEEHRDFLLRPNPAVWMRDMKAMKRAGTNMLRTGLWHKWARHSHRDGRPRLEAQRAFEAFLLSAGHHDLPVIFNFFAFVPHAWNARHPYLDAKALAAQKLFLGGFAAVAKLCDFVAWDLINEPSVTDNKHVWSTEPVGGPAEKAAWQQWIKEEYGDLAQARLAWRLPPDWEGAPPSKRDFGDTSIFDHRHPLLAAAFQRFAQKVFCDWTQLLARQLRKSGASAHLVTVGQDEGGSNTRPSPLFHGHLVDFTSNHTWHYQDDILWDTVIAHRKGMPLLIEEVGVMPHRFPNRASSRTLPDVAMMLERKLALALGGGAAGFIQWLWNTNSYLPTDTEAGIGLLLADGAEKPEMRVYAAMAKFSQAIGPWLGRVEEPTVCVVYPQSDSFSVRSWGIEAHQRAVRCLEYRLGLATRVVGEYQSQDVAGAKLIVVPAHETLSQDCWKNLLHAVERGARVSVTGDIRHGADYRPVSQLDFLVQGLKEDLVARVEVLRIGKKQHEVTFPMAGTKPLRTLRSRGPNQVLTCAYGKGTIVFSPVPLEGATSEAALLDFYRLAAADAGLTISPQAAGCLVRRVVLPRANLIAVVNETSVAIPFKKPLPKGSLPAGRCALFLTDKKSGRCLAAYQPPRLD